MDVWSLGNVRIMFSKMALKKGKADYERIAFSKVSSKDSRAARNTRIFFNSF